MQHWNNIEPRLLAEIESQPQEQNPIPVLIECRNGAVDHVAASLQALGCEKPEPLPLVPAIRALLTPEQIRQAASNPTIRSIVWDRAEGVAV